MGELITNAAKEAGAGGGTILMGRGTAANEIIQLLGFGDTSKDIAYVVVDDSILEKTILSVKEATSSKKSHFGVMFTVNVSDFIRSGNQNSVEESKGENDMSQKDSYKLINVIVNKGYADDAMAAARKAGAGGGTIIGARGTAKEGDAKFFGAEIVPEKDMLLILVPKEKCDDIVNAIQSLPCFAKAGSGIIFCSNAHDFTLLGKSEKAE
jgi:nitrogen regulatory protein PII